MRASRVSADRDDAIADLDRITQANRHAQAGRAGDSLSFAHERHAVQASPPLGPHRAHELAAGLDDHDRVLGVRVEIDEALAVDGTI